MGDPFELWLAEFYAGVGTRLAPALRAHCDMVDQTVIEMLDSALDQTVEEYMTRVFSRYEFREQIRQFFTRFDLLVSPTLPVTAFDISLPRPAALPHRNIVNWISYTYPFNLLGYPAATLPCGVSSDALPIGLQLVARTNRECDIFRVAAAFEQAKPWEGLRLRLG